ncbi:MAG TPA: hypothetical protein VED01_03395 [Burkholderiales bacterium]|nr:hypothetical protein [Burkholderiales bacterium]
MTEQIATVALSRDERSLYTVTITFTDDTQREVTSAEWKTLMSAMDFAAKLIAGELSKRQTLGEVP